MDYEIHIYLGTACIAERSTYNYPVGEKHPILFYLREDKDSEYNDLKAKQIVTNLAFDKVEFTKVGKLSLYKLKTDEQKRNYESAIKSGSALVLYSEPVASSPE
jgi:hypothetical protein